jgi:hypothetical protein
MPSSKSLAMFDDCRVTLDEALEAQGLEINFESYAKAVVFRRRCNHFRVLDRNKNFEIYPEDNPCRDSSVYDALELSLQHGSTTVVIRPRPTAGTYQKGPLGTFTARKPPE